MKELLIIFVYVFSAFMFVNFFIGFIDNPWMKIFAAFGITGFMLIIFVFMSKE